LGGGPCWGAVIPEFSSIWLTVIYLGHSVWHNTCCYNLWS